MRYLVVCVLAGLLAWPQSAAAQTGDEAPTSAALAVHAKYHLPSQLMLRASSYLHLDTATETDATSDQIEPNAEEPVSEPAPEEPALELKLDDAGVQVAPTEESQQTKQRSPGAKAGIAIGVIGGFALVGVIGAAVAMSNWEWGN